MATATETSAAPVDEGGLDAGESVDLADHPRCTATAELLCDPVVSVDCSGRICYANSAVKAVLGYTRAEIVGQPVDSIFRTTIKQAESYARKVCGDRAPPEREPRLQRVSARHKDGQEVSLELAWGTCCHLAGPVLTAVARNAVDDRSRTAAQRTTAELQAVNTELAVLYRVSSTLIGTMELDALLHEVLRTVTELDVLKLERKGGILLINGGRLDLVAHLGHDEGFLRSHENLRVGQCLCGRVAATGQILVARDCSDDPMHTIKDPTAGPHGHVILPLKSHGRVLGVLYLYLPANVDLDGVKMKTLEAVGHQIGMAIENARLYESTKAMALHDPLTGLANRRLVQIFLERNVARVKRSGGAFSLIMLDIDHFKDFNDAKGHSAGDDALKAVANTMLATVREADLAARYGGEEFLVLLPETPLHKATEAAERIRCEVARQTLVTVSLGVVAYREGMVGQQSLLDCADAALYEAKRRGRNRCHVFGDDSGVRAS